MAAPRIPAPPRFWAKVQRGGPNDCWNWTAARRSGYGAFAARNRRLMPAHRYAWELEHGPVPEGLWVLHQCDNRRCVNPAHLFLGDVQANVDDMRSKGRARWGEYLKERTHCSNGHEFTPANTSARPRSEGRTCLTCSRERWTRRKMEGWRRASRSRR